MKLVICDCILRTVMFAVNINGFREKSCGTLHSLLICRIICHDHTLIFLN